jgi:hypothetical protein
MTQEQKIFMIGKVLGNDKSATLRIFKKCRGRGKRERQRQRNQ